MSRRSYYTGTALLGVAMAVADGLALTALQAIERATGGWGVRMHFFQVPVHPGRAVVPDLAHVVRRAGPAVRLRACGSGSSTGAGTSSAWWPSPSAQVAVVLAAVLLVVWADAWSGVGHFFTALTAAGLTGLLAGLAALLVAGGHATIRPVTV